MGSIELAELEMFMIKKEIERLEKLMEEDKNN